MLEDLSGMVWIAGDLFVAVHDAKVADENFAPRVSSLNLPADLREITFTDNRASYKGEVPNDLESVAQIPGTSDILLVENGDSKNDPSIQRIFKASVKGGRVRIVSVTNWPVNILKVERTAVAKVGDKFVFLCAERADKEPSTEIGWIEFTPDNMEFSDTVNYVEFKSPDDQRYNRVIVGLDVDSQGYIYGVSAFDTETAGLDNPDNGLYASGVYAIGSIQLEDGVPSVDIFPKSIEIAAVDGFKVETVAIRQDSETGKDQLLIGTDDENYGGTIRQLPIPTF